MQNFGFAQLLVPNTGKRTNLDGLQKTLQNDFKINLQGSTHCKQLRDD